MKLPTGKTRSESIAKKISSGTSPGTATVRQPVRGSRIAFNSSTSGTPGCDSFNRSIPSRKAETTRVPSSSTWRANSKSQTAWSSSLNELQFWGTIYCFQFSPLSRGAEARPSRGGGPVSKSFNILLVLPWTTKNPPSWSWRVGGRRTVAWARVSSFQPPSDNNSPPAPPQRRWSMQQKRAPVSSRAAYSMSGLNDQWPKSLPYIALPTLLYIVLILLPRLLNAPIAAIEIKVATSAYSIALAPFSQPRSFVSPRIPHSLVNKDRALSAGRLTACPLGTPAKSLLILVKRAVRGRRIALRLINAPGASISPRQSIGGRL